METKKSKTVFIEYSSADKGQHFMTVMQTSGHERTIIGRIYREYNKETKKTLYHAVDWAGNKVFVDAKDIFELKRKFIESGKSMAMSIPKNPRRQFQNARILGNEKPERKKEVNNIREKKKGKEKTIEISKQGVDEKTNQGFKDKSVAQRSQTDKGEKGTQSKNKLSEAEQEKLAEEGRRYEREVVIPEEEAMKEISAEMEQDQIRDQQDNEISEREEELDDIRAEQDEERDQDLDLDR